MSKSALTAERLRELLHYDPKTGVFVRKQMKSRYGTTAPNSRYSMKAAGCLSSKHGPSAGYVKISVDGRRYFAHRLAWLYVYGAWPSGTVDHINGDRSDNRIENLRDVAHYVNIQNQRKVSVGNKYSSLLGAHWSITRKKWRSSIMVKLCPIHLGWFDTDEEAHQAYLTAKRRLHEGCTI